METNIQDIWMILKDNWVPRPGWLGNDIACLAAPEIQSPETQADALGGRREAQIAPQGARDPSTSKNESLPIGRPKRKNKPASRPAIVPPAIRGSHSYADSGRSDPWSRAGNVVEFRPRARDYAYADCLLEALCAACEAQAAGQDDVMMARIRQLYHLFEDVAG
jgi:hypothetical protein